MTEQPSMPETSRRYLSEAMASIHEMMRDLHEADVIDEGTMREFDELCLNHPVSQNIGLPTHNP